MPKRDPIASESDRHKEAFELYYAQGEKRSFPRLAKALGVSMAALKVWSKSFSWQKRLQERDAAVARQAADQVIGSAVVNATRKRKMVELALMKVIKAINSDKVKIQVGDLDRLLRLSAFLDGDGVVVTGETLRQRPMQEVLDAYWEWIHQMTDEQLNDVIKLEERRKEDTRAATPAQTTPANPRPAVDSPPGPGETHGETPNPTR
ncbi:MAG: hypothetical protein HZB43_01380 [candidate division Zixibacteria bacterium]|nr:hypothetical protein [candidate division Zixibacteria bacterium]